MKKCPATIPGMINALKEKYRDHYIYINRITKCYRRDEAPETSYEFYIGDCNESIINADKLNLLDVRGLVLDIINKEG